MTWQEYINSGLLELYVAGTLSPEEMEEIRKLEKEHPELAAEIDKIQQAIILYAAESIQSFEMPIFDEADFASAQEQGRKENIKSLPTTFSNKPSSWLSVAAAIIALISICAAIYMYMQVNMLQNKMAEINKERVKYDSLLASQLAMNDSLKQGLSQMRSHFAAVQDHINDTSTQKIILEGLDLEPSAKAMVFWNESTKKVYISATNLPAVTSEHQYQLWALVDGKPVDAGVFSNINELQFTKNIEQADAFAVTLEPKGGSKTPTLEKLYVLGNVPATNS